MQTRPRGDFQDFEPLFAYDTSYLLDFFRFVDLTSVSFTSETITSTASIEYFSMSALACLSAIAASFGLLLLDRLKHYW